MAKNSRVSAASRAGASRRPGAAGITAGSDTVGMLAAYLGMLEAEFEVHEPPELVDQVRAQAGRYHRATRPAAD